MSSEEIAVKLSQVRELINKKQVEGILISKRDVFSWLTAGKKNYVSKATDSGFADLLVTKDNVYCVANQIEMPRLEQEELKELDFEPIHYDWWKNEKIDAIKKIIPGLNIASDSNNQFLNVYEELKRLRYSLLPQEVERFREVGYLSAKAIEDTCFELHKGITENEVAALISQKAIKNGVEAEVTLVAFDERIFNFRHPISTEKRLDKYAMLVICGQKYGLVANVTRLVHLGEVPEVLKDKYNSLTIIEGKMLLATKLGEKVSNIFEKSVKAYELQGYNDEWKFHHQGGAAGYAGREYLAIPDSVEIVQNNQAFAWNPSISGVKLEDTIIVSDDKIEIITQTKDFPLVNVLLDDGRKILRPDILVL